MLISFEGDRNPAYGYGNGHATILNQHDETARELRAGNRKPMDKHELPMMDERTALIRVYQPVPMSLDAIFHPTATRWSIGAPKAQ